MVTPSPRLPGRNGLKLQFHWVPCSLEIVRVPVGPLPELEDPLLLEGELELHAASAAASSAAAPVRIRRLIAMVLRFVSPGFERAEAGSVSVGVEWRHCRDWVVLPGLLGQYPNYQGLPSPRRKTVIAAKG